jgi:hypothetical protein
MRNSSLPCLLRGGFMALLILLLCGLVIFCNLNSTVLAASAEESFAFLVYHRTHPEFDDEQEILVATPPCGGNFQGIIDGVYGLRSSNDSPQLLLPSAACLTTSKRRAEVEAGRPLFVPYANSVLAFSKDRRYLATVGLHTVYDAKTDKLLVFKNHYKIFLIDLKSEFQAEQHKIQDQAEVFEVFDSWERSEIASKREGEPVTFSAALPQALRFSVGFNENFQWGANARFILSFSEVNDTQQLLFRVFNQQTVRDSFLFWDYERHATPAERSDLGTARSFALDYTDLDFFADDAGINFITHLPLTRTLLPNQVYLLNIQNSEAMRMVFAVSPDYRFVVKNELRPLGTTKDRRRQYQARISIEAPCALTLTSNNILDPSYVGEACVAEPLWQRQDVVDTLYTPDIQWIEDELAGKLRRRLLFSVGIDYAVLSLDKLFATATPSSSPQVHYLNPTAADFITSDNDWMMHGGHVTEMVGDHSQTIDRPQPDELRRFFVRANPAREATLNGDRLVVIEESAKGFNRRTVSQNSPRLDLESIWGFPVVYHLNADNKQIRYGIYPLMTSGKGCYASDSYKSVGKPLWEAMQGSWWECKCWNLGYWNQSYRDKVEFWLNASIRYPYNNDSHLYFVEQRDTRDLVAGPEAPWYGDIKDYGWPTLSRVAHQRPSYEMIERLTPVGWRSSRNTENTMPIQGVRAFVTTLGKLN